MVRSQRAGSRFTSGQTALESALLLPLFLPIALAVLQVCHLGLGIAVVDYAVSSVARSAVQNNDANLTDGSYATQFNNLMVAGLHSLGQPAHKDDPAGDPLTPTITVSACAELGAYPLVGELVKSISGHVDSSTDCSDSAQSFGPVRLTGSGPYKFVIRGQTTVRLNYQNKG